MIALIDSGIGGLTVYQALKKIRPDIQTVYIADQKNFPYGLKTKEQLQYALKECIEIAYRHRILNAYIACHTGSIAVVDSGCQAEKICDATLELIQTIRADQKVGILGTCATINSNFYQKALKRIGCSAVATFALQDLIQLIERKEWSKEKVAYHLKDLEEYNPQVVLLASTHFPHIKWILEEKFPQTTFLDPSIYFAEKIAASIPFCDDNLRKEDIFISTKGDINFLSILQKNPINNLLKKDLSRV
jgi:glutamate racemase